MSLPIEIYPTASQFLSNRNTLRYLALIGVFSGTLVQAIGFIFPNGSADRERGFLIIFMAGLKNTPAC